MEDEEVETYQRESGDAPMLPFPSLRSIQARNYRPMWHHHPACEVFPHAVASPMHAPYGDRVGQAYTGLCMYASLEEEYGVRQASEVTHGPLSFPRGAASLLFVSTITPPRPCCNNDTTSRPF